MTRIGYYLGKLPGVPSYRDRGAKKLRKALADYDDEFDADLIALVRTDDGWRFEPCRRHDIDGEPWAEPLDSDAAWYRCDGVPDDPPELFGVPVALGYENFGCLSEVPNTRFVEREPAARDTATDGGHAADSDQSAGPASGDGDGASAEQDTAALVADVNEVLEETAVTDGGQPVAAPEDDEDGGADAGGLLAGLRERWGAWRHRRRVAKRNKRLRKGLRWMQAGTTALLIKQDGDAVLTCKQARYETNTEGPEWYVTERKKKKYDARGAGAAPIPLEAAEVAVAFGPRPKLVAPVALRIARNIHSLRVTTRPPATESADGPAMNGQPPAVADGGQPARHNDIRVEERALVWPGDINLLGGEHETQDHLDTLEQQVRAKANPPGGEWLESAGRLGGVILAFILGAVLGDPSGLFELAGIGWLGGGL